MNEAIDVKSLRSRLGLTQSQLAAELGVDQGTVSNWETGKTEPTGPARRLMARMAAAAPSKQETAA
jgi:putative transcriptional regulator